MKTLIVYYSRTGTTRKVAEILAKEMKADVEEITEKINRKGILGYLRAGRDGMKRICTPTDPVNKDYKKYDFIIIGTPIWAGNMCSPIRTYLTNNKLEKKKVAMLITSGGGNVEKTTSEIKTLIPNANIIEGISVRKKEVGEAENKIKEWIKKIKPSLSSR